MLASSPLPSLPSFPTSTPTPIRTPPTAPSPALPPSLSPALPPTPTLAFTRLGLNTFIFSFTFYIFNFLATASAPLVAERRGAGDVEGADKLVADTLVIAAGLGLAVLALLQAFGVPVSCMLHGRVRSFGRSVGWSVCLFVQSVYSFVCCQRRRHHHHHHHHRSVTLTSCLC